jgi:hypothetical protein
MTTPSVPSEYPRTTFHCGYSSAGDESGEKRHIMDAACNQTAASRDAGYKTLLYGSRGRALWFTAICRRRVIP